MFNLKILEIEKEYGLSIPPVRYLLDSKTNEIHPRWLEIIHENGFKDEMLDGKYIQELIGSTDRSWRETQLAQIISNRHKELKIDQLPEPKLFDIVTGFLW